MINYIITQWKAKKIAIVLIIMGFFVGSLVLSVGTSVTVENYNYICDQTSGNPEHQLEVTINSENGFESEEISKLLYSCSQYGEMQILDMEKARLNNFDKEYQVVPVIAEKKSSWHIPLISGKYFEPSKSTEKEVILGKNIANEYNIKENDTVYINGEEYNVIGVCGRTIRETQWDDVMYVNYADFIKNNKNYVESVSTISCLLKDGVKSFVGSFSELEEEAKGIKATIFYNFLEATHSCSTFINSLIATIVSSIFIFMIAIVNIVNLMIYWITERRREFGIMKALGASNGVIVKWVIIEVIAMTLISALLAVGVQMIISRAFSEVLIKYQIYFSVSAINVIVSISVAAVCGLIAAIVPAARTMNIQPVEVIQYE